MKILLTIHHDLDSNAGAPGVTLKLGEYYQKQGHQVEYYSFDQLPRKLPELAKAVLFPEFVAAHLIDRVHKQSFDVINASSGDAWIWGKLFQKMPNRPLLVAQSHGLEHIAHLECLEDVKRGKQTLSWKYPLYHGGFRLWEVANSFRVADRVFLLNPLDRDYVVNQLGIPADRAFIFANGIPDSFLNQPFVATPTDPYAPIRIAFIGSYIPRKGTLYSAPALNAVLARHPHVTLSLIGTNRSKEQIYQDFEPALHQRIQVVPNYAHDQLPTLLQGHHIKLFPSLSEGFSLALPEAMASGLAPLVTDIPSFMEIIKPEYNGAVVPVRDSEAIATELERLILDRTYLDYIRRNAHATAQQYGWEQIATARLAVYQDAIAQRKQAQRS